MRDEGMMTMYRAIIHPMLMLNFLVANFSGVCPALTWATGQDDGCGEISFSNKLMKVNFAKSDHIPLSLQLNVDFVHWFLKFCDIYFTRQIENKIY